MEHLNRVLSVVAPWVWVAECLFADSLLGRAFLISRKRSNATTKHVKKVTGLLIVYSVGLTLVGLLSIAIYFTYPQLQQARFTVPVLLQWSQLVSLLFFISLPGALGLIGYWKMRFLLTDDIGSPSSTPSGR